MTSVLTLAVVVTLAAAAAVASRRRRVDQPPVEAAVDARDQSFVGTDPASTPEDALAATVAGVTRHGLVLLQRVLDDLQQLQREEVDPTRLQGLYALDHLAMRLRRHNENLLVLSGAAPTSDPDEAPMRLVDLVRLAASGTEDYTRVRVEITGSQKLRGWAVQPAAQLLAALLDNALAYSPPSEPVRVACHRGSETLSFAVADSGIGMDESAMAEANALLDESPDLRRTGSRLGLAVCARLARRLGASVELRPSLDGGAGITAVVMLPVGLLHDTPAEVDLVAAQNQDPLARAGDLLDFAAEAADRLSVLGHFPPVPLDTDGPVRADASDDGAAEGDPPSTAPVTDDGRRRWRRSRADIAWSMAMPGRPKPTAPTTSFVAAPDPRPSASSHADAAFVQPAPAPRPTAAPPGNRPAFVQALQRAASTGVDGSAVDSQADDAIPEVVDNPIVATLDHHRTPSSLAELLQPEAETAGPMPVSPPILDGIVLRAAAEELPTRPAPDAPVPANAPRLFADAGLHADAEGVDGDGTDALVGLAESQRRNRP